MAFCYFFSPARSYQEKTESPNSSSLSGFPIGHRCYSGMPFSLRSSTQEQVCTSPAAVPVAPRWRTGWDMRQGAPMGASRVAAWGRALLGASTHRRATSENTRSSGSSPQLHTPPAASRAGCFCTAAPWDRSPCCSPGFSSFI